MNSEEIPQLSDESKQELSQLLADFFKRQIQSETPLANIEVEIKFKPSSESSESIKTQSIKMACYPGRSGPGCNPGYYWKISSPPIE